VEVVGLTWSFGSFFFLERVVYSCLSVFRYGNCKYVNYPSILGIGSIDIAKNEAYWT
jgi:hypothetical protein